MTRKQNGLGLALLVIAGCLALLLLLIGLASQTNGDEANQALGFPLVLGGIVVAAALLALVWRAVSRSRSND